MMAEQDKQPLEGIMKDAFHSYEEWHLYLVMRLKQYKNLIERVEGREVDVDAMLEQILQNNPFPASDEDGS